MGLTLLVLAGCSTTQLYDGPKQPESEIVRVEGVNNPEAAGYKVVVCQINGESLSPCKNEIEILPGKHTLKLELVKSGVTRQTSYNRKVFRAGDRYLMAPGKLTGSGQPRLKFWRDKNVNE